MATLSFRNWHGNDDGTPRPGASVVYKGASDAEPNANPVLGTTTTNASGEWEFTGVPDGEYDVYLTDGVTVRIWKGRAALPLSFARAPVGPVANALVDGDFIVWQRGTTFASVAASTWTADRWQWLQAGSGVVTVARDTSVPAVAANSINTPYSLKITVGTADAAIAAGDYYAIHQPVEGFDYRPLTNGFALSFWVSAHRTGTYCVAFRNRGTDRAWVAEYTVNVADTWEYKTVVVTTPPTAGTWDYTTGIGLGVYFILAAGSSSQGTAGAWQSSGILATSNQVNGVGATTDVFQIALVNLIPGATAAPLVPLPYQQQLARCQRYFEILANTLNAVPGSGFCFSTTVGWIPLRYAVPKGVAPTINISAAAHFSVLTAAGATNALSGLTTAGVTTDHDAVLQFTAGTASLVAGNGTALQVTNASGVISAERNPA